MFNWLLEMSDSGVIGDIITENSSPDGYGVTAVSNYDFYIGALCGFGFAILLYVVYKLSVYLFFKELNKTDESD